MNDMWIGSGTDHAGFNAGQVILENVHDPARCDGQGCVLHHPSDHHMREWPTHWRADTRLMERICPHGVGHPDPDDDAHFERIGQGWKSVHGCDGCC